MSVTVQNEKISVTISDEIYNQWLVDDKTQTLPSGEIRVHLGEKITRGLILSHAMSILGNQYEAMLLDQEEFQLDEMELSQITAQAKQSAKNSYIREWLDQHSKYQQGLVFFRYECGHRLGQGMQFEIDSALAYANSALGEIDFEKLFHDTSAKYSEYRTRMIFEAVLDGKNKHMTPEQHAESIIAFRKYMFELERQYRHRFDGSKFTIKVLRPDLMPTQIGVCRYGQ